MRKDLDHLAATAKEHIAAARDAAALERVELAMFGRKQGKLTEILRGLGKLSPVERAEAGKRANEVRVEVERLLAARGAELAASRYATLAQSEWIDVTAPGVRLPRGSVHPVSQAMREITAIFERIGFIRSRHPEVDSDYYAFEALNMPAGHPARDEWETFFVATPTKKMQHAKRKMQNAERAVLTPHTSNGQVREMEKGILPIRMVNIGTCYRRQIDATHTPMFHQFEGLLVDRDVSITNLKGTLDYFVQSYFGPDRRIRLRPFHFQFTEPSFEIDISCGVCGGDGGTISSPPPGRGRQRGGGAVGQAESNGEPHEVGTPAERCKTCKSGWLELGGAGMVHPSVLKAGGIDPKKHSGFAFGWGVERVLMMKHGVSDIRLLYGNDLRRIG